MCSFCCLLQAATYLYGSGRGEERSETTLALDLLLGGEEEEGLEEVKSYLLDGKGERVTSSLTYAVSQTSQVRARHWQWKANGSVAERKMISHTFLEIPIFIRISSYHSKLETSKK